MSLLVSALSLSLQAQTNSDRSAYIYRPSAGVQIPLKVRRQIAGIENVEAWVTLHNGDFVLVYDTVRDDHISAEFMDNHPHIVLIRNNEILLNVDALMAAPAGPVGFDGMALLPLSKGKSILALAFALGVDRAGTFFLILDQISRVYKIAATLQGTQAQIRFTNGSSGQFELWSADGPSSPDTDKQCVWCPNFYKKTRYSFASGKLRKLHSTRSLHGYKPEQFFNAPFLLIK